MKRHKTSQCTLLILAISGIFSGSILAQHKTAVTVLENPITEAYLKEHLAKQSPKLFLTPEIEEIVKQKLQTDTLVQNYYHFLQEEAERILDIPVSKHQLTGFRFEVTRETLRRFGILCMVYRMEETPEIADRINKELLV